MNSSPRAAHNASVPLGIHTTPQVRKGSTFPAYFPSDGGAFGGFVEAKTLTDAELKALQRAGIQYAQPLAPDTTATDFHPTMYPYAATLQANQLDLSSAGAVSKKFAVIDPSTNSVLPDHFLQTARQADPTARYVVFGVGPRCSLVGQGIQDAPTSVPQKKTFTPDTTYSRLGVIFKVSGTEVARSERARFIAAVALEDDELESTEKDIIGYYEVSRDPRN